MRLLLLTVALATLAALSIGKKHANSTAVQLISKTLTKMDSKLAHNPNKLITKLGHVSCDGSYYSCLSSLRMCLRKLGQYLDCSNCCRCRISKILIEIKISLQVHFRDSNPYECIGCNDGCQSVSCLTRDIREILVNILGDCEVCSIDSCESELCHLRQIIVLLRRVCIVIAEEPVDDCWGCLIRRCVNVARRRRHWGDESSIEVLIEASVRSSMTSFRNKKVKHRHTKPILPTSCKACLKKNGCKVCRALFNCKCT